jgi:hypothetical protein
VGQFAEQDFYGAQHSAASFIVEPMGYALNNLFDTYESFDPPSTPAAEVRVVPVRHTYVKSMVAAGDPAPFSHNQTGLVPTFRGSPVSVSEIGFTPGKKASSLRAFAQHYTPEFGKRWNRYALPVGGSRRCDETYIYIKVKGEWVYVYLQCCQLHFGTAHAQGISECSLGTPIIFRQAYCNARPIIIRWVRPTDVYALPEHGCRESFLPHSCVKKDEVCLCCGMLELQVLQH